ncbi:DUF2254 domain-containing protein [Halolamina sp. CBA1230]|uniref:DUF2254 family protein n=1 Tax=Halolamina sp. CBA1230 TaxID=1853690 RepID=UPI00117A5AC9|nr:DUF2254 family protein [Halolamina sp. CBA1230]QKY19689.1 DUF2254 domain-containing protein [Halolamina sp. CBA1230]
MDGIHWAERQWWLLGALSMLSSIVAVSLFPAVGSNTEAILSTLATLQAAIFAIVFSVIVLGVQLSASRYSARVAATFTSGRDYLRTVTVFGASIASSVLGLYFTTFSGPILTVYVITCGFLAVGAFLTLYQFVDSILEKTTPEGVITLLSERLQPDTIEKEARVAADDPTKPDPFLAIVSTISSLISEKDRAAAILGQRMLKNRLEELFVESEGHLFEENSPLDQSLENLLSDQLPNLVEESLSQDLKPVATEVPETAEYIGSKATENNLSMPFQHVVKGQTDLIDGLGFDGPEESVRKDAIDTVESLLGNGIEQELFEEAAIGVRRLGWVAAASAMMRSTGQISKVYTSLLISTFPKFLSKALNKGDELTDLRVDRWLRVHILDVSPIQKVIGSCYGSMAELTSAAIRFELKTEEQFVNWNMVGNGWTRGAENLDQSELESMAELWYGTILYLRYIDDVSPEHVMEDFDIYTSHRLSSDLPVRTADRIINGSLDPTSVIDFMPGSVDPVELPLTGVKTPPVEGEPSFTEWVQSQRHLLDTSRRSGMYGSVDPPFDESDDED